MPDLLVKLYDLPDDTQAQRRVAEAGVTLRRAMPYDRHHVEAFIAKHFSQGWTSEALSVWSRQPIPCVLALREERLVGFANYDTTMRGFFGPTGVAESQRGRGIGEALLHASLRGLRELGYGYAIIGSAGPVAWYEKTIGAAVIDGSEPGVYANFIKGVAE
ncbi:MAG: GNAT family N-acetyltransferase [Planctomycetota bacterium]